MSTPNKQQEPARCSYSLEEMKELLSKWMVQEFGNPRDDIKDLDQKDKWYRDYGLIFHFLRDHYPSA